jgi:aerobic-type carbon monoxide dehydrogenase small subunit (CoxS/CutS family)
MSQTKVEFRLNGQVVKDTVESQTTLAEFLNEDLGLTGTKTCCEMGICKACTVAVAKTNQAPLEAKQACLLPVASLNGQSITTVEGLDQGGTLSPLQESFLKNFAFQCGFSTAGFLMGATVLLDRLKRHPIAKDQVDDTVKEALGSHVCRCTGYVKYYQAIKEAILATPGTTL